ncbi:MAG: hypothetical protein ACRD19_02615, partial [Terriglobia bacterium]
MAVSLCFALAMLWCFTGCAIAPAPIKDTPKVATTPQKGELTVAAVPSTAIGDVEPVYVSVANGTDVPRQVVPDQIFALDDNGNRIAPIPADEAARQVGGSGELKAALESGAASGVVEGGLGAGIGALAGSFFHSGAAGAVLGGAVGGAEGLVGGATSGPSKATNQATSQVSALALQPEDVRQNFTVSGYVFFP